MFPEMSHRELLEGSTTLQIRHCMFGNALLPVDWLWLCLWCCNSNDTIRVLLDLQSEKTAIGMLKGCLHLVWGQSVSLNLCEHEVCGHFEERLGHGMFLRMSGWKEQRLFALGTVLWMI